jgi:SPP1 family predicted phage head-tail adaptor
MPKTLRLTAGKLRHRIQIVTLDPSTGQDSTGGFDLSKYVTYATVWASVQAISGTEQLAAGAQTSQVNHQIVIRYLPGVTAAMQALFQTRKYQITAVRNPDGRRKMLVLDCVLIADGVNQ